MTDLNAELAVQSYCFRNFKDNRKVIELVRECGLSAIELCGVHADFADPAGFADVAALYRENGIRIVSIGVQTLAGNEAIERNYFECVRAAGAKCMSVAFAVDKAPEAYRVAEELAAEYEIRLGIHNHGGHHWLGSAQMLGHVFNTTNDRIGLCLDTAWAIDAGEDPVRMADRFAARLVALHFKDFLYDQFRRHRDVVIGTGILDLPALLGVLRKHDFEGAGILEYEGDVEDPAPAIKQCVEVVRRAWADSAV